MALVELDISNLRNLDQVRLVPGPKINILHGDNGAGKTSVLEAIYMLGTGKSFRTSKINKVIGNKRQDATIFGQISKPHVPDRKLGIRRSTRNLEIRIDGAKNSSRAALAQTFPLMVITPESHSLLASGPSFRRRYLDWGVFHVEHSYSVIWSEYNKVIKHRNSLLAQNAPRTELEYWDSNLIGLADKILDLRLAFIQSLMPFAQQYCEKLIGSGSIELEYKPGIPGNLSFEEMLNKNRQRDILLGRTEYGPHRADLGVKLNGCDISERVSRGQQKLLVYALQLAQCALLREKFNQVTGLLLDDLSAELDSVKMSQVNELLIQEFGQIFITTTSLNLLPASLGSDAAVFHVEHGNVQ